MDSLIPELLEVRPNNCSFSMKVAPEHYHQYLNNLNEKFSVELLLNRLTDETIFIDAGAHFGYYTAAAGTRNTKCRILSFEPSPMNYEVLKKNVELNGLENVKTYDLALSNEEKIAGFIIAGHSDHCGFYEHKLSPVKEKIQVKTATIDGLFDVLPLVPVIVKIHVEGHEIQVLEGMENLIKNGGNVELFVEFNPTMIRQSGHQPEELIGKIYDLGFDVFVIEDEKRATYKLASAGDWKDFFGDDREKNGYCNLICVRSERSLNLCIFSHSSELEGAERSLLELATELIRDHHALCTVILRDEGPLKERLERIGCSTLVFNYSWWCGVSMPSPDDVRLMLDNSISLVCERSRQIARINPDVILTNTLVIPWGAITAYLLDKPHIWHVREFGERDHNLKFYLPFGEVVRHIATSNLVVTNSAAVRNALFGDSEPNVVTIYNHIEIPAGAAGTPEVMYFKHINAIKLIILGRITEEKGQSDAVQAVKILSDKGCDVELEVIGTYNPDYLQKLKDAVKRDGIEDRVHFHEFIPNPYQAMNQADVVLVCSKNEAFGRTIAEAALLGKPVVATNSGGAPEIVREGYSGLLYEPGNSRQLADRIEYLAANRGKLSEMGENGRRFIGEKLTAEHYGGEIFRHALRLKKEPNRSASSLALFVTGLFASANNRYAGVLRDYEARLAAHETQDSISAEKAAALTKQVNALTEKTQALTNSAKGLEDQIKDKDARLTDAMTRVSQQAAELSSIEESLTWRSVQKYQQALERTMPPGTRRRAAYNRGFRGLRILAGEGPGSLWRNIRAFARTRDRSKKRSVASRRRVGDEGFPQAVRTAETRGPGSVAGRTAAGSESYLETLFDQARSKSGDYVPVTTSSVQLTEDDVKLIAFYLPQFHPIPENDRWWGKGFTEWTNVTRAVPQFAGHYQPHLPGELGFYDLRMVEVQKRQAELAKQYGVYGFCFYYYWFGGKRLLETPLEQFLRHPEIDMPFCLCWANENWTRRWDGRESEVLIAQDHTPGSDIQFIKDAEPYLRDPRYIRINGKPVLLVYKVRLLPDVNETVKIWREYCVKAGIGDLYLIAVQGFGFSDPRECGFDAAVEFPPNTLDCKNITSRFRIANPGFAGNVFDYAEYVRSKRYLKPVDYTLFHNVSPGWDNTARRPDNGSIYWGSEPEVYKEWLTNVIRHTKNVRSRDEQVVFVNAWNEWAEGAHLEPDRKYGYAYLQATADALRAPAYRPEGTKKIIYVSHDAYYHGAQMLALNTVKLLKEQFHYDVSLILKSGGPLEDEFKKYASVYNLERDFPSAEAVEDLIDQLIRQGASAAICNTVVSGDLAKTLSQKNIRVLALIHELPELIRAYHMEDNAKTITRYADKVVFPSDFVREKFETIARLDEDKRAVRPQGLYLHNAYKDKREAAKGLLLKAHSLPASAKVVLAVGYADSRKGADLFVAVAKKVLRSDPDVYFLWVGHHDADFMKNVLADIEKSGIGSRVLFPGIKKEIGLYYAGADLYLMTSREDPFPSTILEAMDAGTPVIGFSGAGGFGDIVTDRIGCLVPYLDTESMSAKVSDLLRDPGLREQMGRNAAAIVSTKYRFADYVYSLLEMLGHPYKKVSVVVPNYNYARYLHKRLETIVCQGYPVYEIIFLDDCSTDDSLAIARDLLSSAGLPVTVIANERNSGSVSKQWAKGIANAKGDYVWIAEADDLSDSGFLAEAMKGFSDEQVVLSYTQSKQMDQNERIMADDYLDYTDDIDRNKWNSDYTRDGLEEIRDTLAVKNTIPNVSAVVFKKFDPDEITDELVQYKVAGDWRFYVWILQKGKISYRAASLNLHRRHTGGVTISEDSKRHFDEIVRMQEYVMSGFDVDAMVKRKVLDYRQKVKEYLLGSKKPEEARKTGGPAKVPDQSSLKLSDNKWLHALVHSSDGAPSLPPEDIQVRFCGRSGQLAMEQAMEFYKVIREASRDAGRPLESMTAILDFGCGWGRIFRCFLREGRPGVLQGCDVMPEMVQLCKALMPQYEFIQNNPLPPTAFKDNTFDLIYAYSVFSHLSEDAHAAWLEEFNRILKPGGLLVLTTRPRGFIEYWPKLSYVRNLDVNKAISDYETGKFVYVPTGGGDNLDKSFYGEAAISERYIAKNWSPRYEIVKFLDNVTHVDQKIIVVRKK